MECVPKLKLLLGKRQHCVRNLKWKKLRRINRDIHDRYPPRLLVKMFSIDYSYVYNLYSQLDALEKNSKT